MIVEIEMFKDGRWVTEIRYYNIQKPLSSFDLYTIEGRRRKAKIV